MPNLKTKAKTNIVELPAIPEKLYFSIGEVAKLCVLAPHVLRYWEQEFTQLNPSKRRGNRRYYQRKDVLMVRQIRSLLYEQGFTIEGARQQLASEGKSPVAAAVAPTKRIIEALEKIVSELSLV